MIKICPQRRDNEAQVGSGKPGNNPSERVHGRVFPERGEFDTRYVHVDALQRVAALERGRQSQVQHRDGRFARVRAEEHLRIESDAHVSPDEVAEHRSQLGQPQDTVAELKRSDGPRCDLRL